MSYLRKKIINFMEIKNTIEIEKVAEFISGKILNKLENNIKVLWFVTGGSGIEVASKVSQIITKRPHANLTIMLTDERYGDVDSAQSNWHQLLELGFVLPEAKLIPILNNKNRKDTTIEFQENLEKYLNSTVYKIGLFGVGADGHTAGILPESEATNSTNLAYEYDTPQFERITMTPRAIKMLDEIIVFMKGEAKWIVVNDLLNKEIDIKKQPAQILKQIPLLTIFTDYQNK